MDLRQLEYFMAVAEQASFTRGAERLGSVQSAASAAVARLEREVGQPLFVRGGRRLELTEAGRLLLARAHVIQEQTEGARTDLQALREGLTGTVTIGTILAFSSAVLPHALQVFHRRFPGVAIRLKLSAGPLSSHLDQLNGSFDLALVPMADQIPSHLTMRPVERVRLGLACPASHALADAQSVDYQDLFEETFIDFPPDWGNRTLVDKLFADEGRARDVAIEVTNVSTALTLVAGGLGLSFVPDQYLSDQSGVATVDLRRPPPTVLLGAAVRNDAPAPAATLFRLLTERPTSKL